MITKTLDQTLPCNGKLCKDCVTCVYDREIPTFHQAKEKMGKTCNYCPYLMKIPKTDCRYIYKCGKATYQLEGSKYFRIVDADAWAMKNIPSPSWCPLSDSDRNKQKQLPMPTTTTAPNSYQAKREAMKLFPRQIEWEDIQEGGIYVVPKILYQPRKIVKVEMRNEYICRCHEVDENGNCSTIVTNLYPSDLDTIMLVKKHEF